MQLTNDDVRRAITAPFLRSEIAAATVEMSLSQFHDWRGVRAKRHRIQPPPAKNRRLSAWSLMDVAALFALRVIEVNVPFSLADRKSLVDMLRRDGGRWFTALCTGSLEPDEYLFLTFCPQGEPRFTVHQGREAKIPAKCGDFKVVVDLSGALRDGARQAIAMWRVLDRQAQLAPLLLPALQAIEKECARAV